MAYIQSSAINFTQVDALLFNFGTWTDVLKALSFPYNVRQQLYNAWV